MKRAIFVLIICLYHFHSLGQAFDTAYKVKGVIPRLKQPKEMDCWITVFAMMYNWKNVTNRTVDQIADKLGDPWKIYYETNAGLPDGDEKKFMQKSGLYFEPPASYTLAAYVELLRQYGPLWIVTGGISGRHARLLIEIDGDGIYDHTNFVFIDPESGVDVSENAMRFFSKYEREAKLANALDSDLKIQIYHY